MTYDHITNINLAYAAGFIDGEGCFSINKNGSVSLVVINTCLYALEFLQTTLGGRVKHRKQTANKPQYVFSIYGSECLEAIEKLRPYLKEKLPQAMTIVDYKLTCKPIRIPGIKGQFTNPLREDFRNQMTELKRL